MAEELLSLTGKQKKFLRGLGNRLEAKVIIGHGGLSEVCLGNLDENLKRDELVKIRLQPTSGLDRKEASKLLCQKSGALEVQVFGKTILLYRKNSEKAIIKLP